MKKSSVRGYVVWKRRGRCACRWEWLHPTGQHLHGWEVIVLLRKGHWQIVMWIKRCKGVLWKTHTTIRTKRFPWGRIASPCMKEFRWWTFTRDVLEVTHGSGNTVMADAIGGVFQQRQGETFWRGVWGPVLDFRTQKERYDCHWLFKQLCRRWLSFTHLNERVRWIILHYGNRRHANPWF